jgi:preprotein translocase subunit SecG
MTARGAANALTRTTAILAIGFFATSLVLGIMARYGERPTDILNRIPAASGSQTAPAGGNGAGGGILNQLGGESSRTDTNGTAPAAPGAAPAAPTGTTAPQAPATPEAPANPVPSSQ